MDRITDRPDMTSAVDRGHKASTQTNNNKTCTSIGMEIQRNFDRDTPTCLILQAKCDNTCMYKSKYRCPLLPSVGVEYQMHHVLKKPGLFSDLANWHIQ